MPTPPRVLGLTLCAVAVAANSARGSAHLWRIQEIFTNQSGTVQFIELVSFGPGEQFVDNAQLTAKSDSAPAKSFMLDGNLNTLVSSQGRTMLLATEGFASLTGAVAPDYTPLPANFFDPNATSITISFTPMFFGTVDSLTFAGSLLPKNGTQSLVDSNPGSIAQLGAALNSPKNFSNAEGSINVAPPQPKTGDFDGDGSVDGKDLASWQLGFGMTAADRVNGDADDDDDVDGADFLAWQRQVGSPSAVAAATQSPEPGAAALSVVAALGVAAVRRRLRPTRD